MKQQGFSLLEIIVAIVLIGLIMTVLMTGFSQFVTGIGYIDRAMQLQTKNIIIARTLRRDLSGLFIPQCILDELRNAAMPQDESQASSAIGKKEINHAQSVWAQPNSSKASVLEGYLFKATTTSGNELTDLRFYSCNALQGYWTEQVGTAKTRVMEVHYRLQEAESSNGTPLYTLMRQERLAHPCISADKQTKLGREVVIASNVVRMTGKFIIIKRPKEEKKEAGDGKAGGNDQSTRDVLLLSEMTSFEREPKKIIEQLKADNTNIPPLLPNFIELTIVLHDTAGVEQELILSSYIPIHPTIDTEAGKKDMVQQVKSEGTTGKQSPQQGGMFGDSLSGQFPI